MNVLDKKLDGDGTWLCEHVDSDGSSSPSRRLSVGRAIDEKRARSTSPRSVWLWCPDCQTHWRVWVDLKIARPYVESPADEQSTLPKLKRFPVLDIDRIATRVCARIPAVRVKQYAQTFPADDDGLWWFYLPGVQNDIQLESSTGACPFLIAHDGMKTSSEALNAFTVREAIDAVVAYMASQGRGEPGRRSS